MTVLYFPSSQIMDTFVLVMSLAAFFIATSNHCRATDPFSEFHVYCKKETYKQKVTKPGCSGSEIVLVSACLGTCASYAQPLEYAPYFKKVCHCCKPTQTKWESFKLGKCSPGVSEFVKVQTVTGCACQASVCT